MKYCMYADPEWLKSSYGLNPSLQGPIHHKELPVVMHSGLTNWCRVMDGVYDQPMTPEQYEKYDVLHLNITPNSIGNIHRIRRHLEECDKKPMLVANIDHAIDMWSGFKRFDIFLEECGMVDRLFGVEPATVDTLSTLLDKKVRHINHPTNVDQLQELYGDLREKDPFPHKSVLVVAHPYDKNYTITTQTLARIKQEDPDLKIMLVGKIEENYAYLKKEYYEFYQTVPFRLLMEIVSRVDCVIDTALTHSGGRVPVECAAVGTPCVGNYSVNTVQKYHMPLTVDIFNAKQIREAVRLALYDGFKPTEPDNYDKSRSYFEEMINE